MERRRARVGNVLERTREGAGRTGTGEEGDGLKVRARGRSPGYDVTNFLYTFMEG
jgi:hypothetical protein